MKLSHPVVPARYWPVRGQEDLSAVTDRIMGTGIPLEVITSLHQHPVALSLSRSLSLSLSLSTDRLRSNYCHISDKKNIMIVLMPKWPSPRPWFLFGFFLKKKKKPFSFCCVLSLCVHIVVICKTSC